MIKRRVFVTGSGGLLGHAVTAAAIGRYEIIGHDSQPADDPIKGPEYLVGDLRDASGLVEAMCAHEVTDVVHSGAISHPMLLADRPSEVVAINVEGTANVLEAARHAEARRVVFISSGAVYGSSSPDRELTEASPLEPDGIYGATKAAGEMLVRGFGARFGLDFLILRPASIYGPRRRTFSIPGHLLACAIDGVPARVHGGDQALDFIHVEDVANAVMLALDTESGLGRAYNIATGVKHTGAEIAGMVRELVPGSRVEAEPGLGDLPAEGHYSIERAKRDLGFQATYDLRQGMAMLSRELQHRPDLRAVARAAG
jgi:nucleoside-diphosphate-sugar epimerase